MSETKTYVQIFPPPKPPEPKPLTAEEIKSQANNQIQILQQRMYHLGKYYDKK